MDVYNDVVYRLSQLGYTVPAGDTPDAAVNYAINRAAEKIKANINRTEIPDGLHYTWVDMAAGLFLFDKKTAGQLDEGFDFTAPAKKITEGDVSVEFAGADDGSSTPEARFDKLINSLISEGKPAVAGKVKLACGQLVKQAIANELIYKDIMLGVVLPSTPKAQKRALTDTEKLAVINADLDAKSRAYIDILLYTGLRRGEALALTIDDIDLEPGQIRIRKKGSAGGHNGIKSIIAQLGTQNFYRVKVGVGAKPKGWDLADYVLGRFSPQERELVDQAIIQAAEAVEMILSQGIEAAMNHYNGAAKKKKAKTQEEAESPQE